jgi:hypothetical protein
MKAMLREMYYRDLWCVPVALTGLDGIIRLRVFGLMIFRMSV